MEILVYGAGALGSLIGGLLARTHEVTLVGRDPHMRRIRADGLRIEGAIETAVRPRTTTDGRDRSADIALVTTKAYDIDDAARALATGEYGIVCPLSNGLVEERFASLETTVLAGTASYGARFDSPGRVRCTGIGEVVVGGLTTDTQPAAERLREAFAAAGVEATAADDMPERRYEKLAVNAAINGPSALARIENGSTLSGPTGPVAREAAREVACVARAEGIDLHRDRAVSAAERVAANTAGNHSSMREDVERGRRTEVDAIYGAVIDRANDVGIDVPVCRLLDALLRGWEAEHGLRPSE
ncbi:ketopantoate reductase family protein [Halorubrum vacuolatum]|uniref:2-dehydropantoate 2-reductase n=1 Tax=Halorubrum vacuolatum TaxID=63740 RepID=A0A238VVN3_HALVU|nr:ketopantoate reductase family protein [Halorubrum vacuolatum]SNR37893.1 ketopantoate reductase [Halorubrum vacuolatum]